MRNGLRVSCHLGQVILVLLAVQVEDFYGNHLNFMRSVVYWSGKVDGNYQLYLWGLLGIFWAITLLALWRKRSLERWLMLGMVLGHSFYWISYSFSTIASYYLYWLLLSLGILLQMGCILLEKTKGI